jgi:hypothetical protein
MKINNIKVFALVGDQCEKGILLDVLFVIDLRKNLFYLGMVVDERVVAYDDVHKILSQSCSFHCI